jgi:hypothetical protein
LQNPSTTYINPGTYTVSLTVANNNGNNLKTVTNYITVYPSPVVNLHNLTILLTLVVPVHFHTCGILVMVTRLLRQAPLIYTHQLAVTMLH